MDKKFKWTDLNCEAKKLGFLLFHCVLLELASNEGKNHQLIILHVCNFISSEFFLFIIHL